MGSGRGSGRSTAAAFSRSKLRLGTRISNRSWSYLPAQPCLPGARFLRILPLKQQFPVGRGNVGEPSPVPSAKEQNEELNN